MNEYSFIKIPKDTEVTMPQTSNQTRKSNKYQQILEAAIKIFARQGYFNATISQIAKEAGVADGTIYLYFQGKEDILNHFFWYKTGHIFERFQKEVNKADNSLDKLRTLIYRHLLEFESDRDMAVVYQVETRLRRRLSDQRVKEMSNMYFDLLAKIIRQGQNEGMIRNDLPITLVKQTIIGAVDEVITTWLYSSRQYELLSMADPLVDILIKGIGQEPRFF